MLLNFIPNGKDESELLTLSFFIFLIFLKDFVCVIGASYEVIGLLYEDEAFSEKDGNLELLYLS